MLPAANKPEGCRDAGNGIQPRAGKLGKWVEEESATEDKQQKSPDLINSIFRIRLFRSDRLESRLAYQEQGCLQGQERVRPDTHAGGSDAG